MIGSRVTPDIPSCVPTRHDPSVNESRRIHSHRQDAVAPPLRTEKMMKRYDCLMHMLLIILPSWLTLPCSAATATAGQTTFYVAMNGNDNDPGTEFKPFATIERARQAVRAVNEQTNQDLVVVLCGGTYSIDKTIRFEPEDSGRNGYNVIYRAATNETPIISGGKPITGWKSDEKGRWKAAAPVENFRQLYVDGVRAVRARGDVPANLEFDGDDGYTTTVAEMADWRNADDIEFCYVVVWAHTRCKIKSIKRQDGRARITMLQPHFANAKAKEGVNIATPKHVDRVWIENALELLDEPGEWYLDRSAKIVYYMPRPGEDMNKAEVIVPAVEVLVELQGTLDEPVKNICFQGITFAYGSWLLPSKIGFVDLQANFVLDWKKPYHRSSGLTAEHNQALKSPSNIICHAAKSIVFERCTFTHLGGGGIDIECGSQDNRIVGCTFCDISGSAIQVGDVLKDDHHPDDLRKIVKNNSIVNSLIRDCGVEYWGSVGVFAGYTEGTLIAHNEIRDLPYSGISVGWGWGEEDAGGGNPKYQQPFKYDTPTTAKRNRIEYNHIHRTMSKTDDGAAIYTLGIQPGSVIRGNYIHDCKNHTSKRGWSQGIYLDEGSGGIEITRNVVYGMTPTHYNNLIQDRKATCSEHDNFFGIKTDQTKTHVEEAGLEAEYQDLLKSEE